MLSDGCISKLYADDVKIYTVVKTLNDCHSLQNSLDALFEWSCAWQLSISYKKCSFVIFDRSQSKFDESLCFHLGGNYIFRKESVKDLGICVDNHLRFSSHINQIVAKAHARACLVHKCFLSKNRDTLAKAFTTYVRPLLEYGTCVWSPHQLEHIRKIESVQRRFTKKLDGLDGCSYQTRLKLLGLDSLELRRLHQDLIFTYKTVFGLIDINCSRFFTVSPCSRTRGHAYKLFVNNSNIDVRKYFWCNRVVRVWNGLPAEQQNFSSIIAFKKFLSRTDLSDFLSVFEY